jgi:hypothetical protein
MGRQKCRPFVFASADQSFWWIARTVKETSIGIVDGMGPIVRRVRLSRVL